METMCFIVHSVCGCTVCVHMSLWDSSDCVCHMNDLEHFGFQFGSTEHRTGKERLQRSGAHLVLFPQTHGTLWLRPKPKKLNVR